MHENSSTPLIPSRPQPISIYTAASNCLHARNPTPQHRSHIIQATPLIPCSIRSMTVVHAWGAAYEARTPSCCWVQPPVRISKWVEGFVLVYRRLLPFSKVRFKHRRRWRSETWSGARLFLYIRENCGFTLNRKNLGVSPLPGKRGLNGARYLYRRVNVVAKSFLA